MKALRWFTWTASFASVIAAQAMLIGYKTYANVDEGYACALAARLLDGAKLYQGAISQRGPLMYYAFEAVAAVAGWDNIIAFRLFGLALALAHVALVYWAARRLLSENAAIVATLVTAYELSFGFPAEDGVAINGETLQLPLLIVAVVLGALAMRFAPRSRGRTMRLVAAGLLFGIASAIKQSAALHPAAIVLWLVIDAHRRRLSWRVPIIETLVLAASVLAVPFLFVVHSALTGTLADLYYYVVVYNRDVHLQPTTRHFKWVTWMFFRLTDQTTFPMITALLVGRAAVWIARRVRSARAEHNAWALWRGFGVRHYIALHFAIAFFSGTLMWRFFPHYYMQSAPFLALSIGAALEPLFVRARSARVARAVTWAFGVFTIFVAAVGCDFAERADGEVSHDKTLKTMARVIDATTKPDDKIFVWGFSSWLYGYAHRKPAGRYVFETYVTGFVPWYWEKLDYERSRIVPGSQEALLSDLEREDPIVIVDAGSVMMARPMRMFPLFSDFLHRRYCFEMRIGALDLYRRKDASGVCEASFFPRASDAYDYRGRAMSIPIPKTVDFADSRRLPRGNFFKPIHFIDGKKPLGLDAAIDPKRQKEEAEGASEGFYVEELEP